MSKNNDSRRPRRTPPLEGLHLSSSREDLGEVDPESLCDGTWVTRGGADRRPLDHRAAVETEELRELRSADPAPRADDLDLMAEKNRIVSCHAPS